MAIPRSRSPLPATAVAPAALATIAPIHPVAAGESGLLAFTVGAPVRMYMGRAAARGRASARPRGHSTSTSTKSISIHHSQSSQSISIYDREIGAKISVSVSISRFPRLDKMYCTVRRWIGGRKIVFGLGLQVSYTLLSTSHTTFELELPIGPSGGAPHGLLWITCWRPWSPSRWRRPAPERCGGSPPRGCRRAGRRPPCRRCRR